MKEEAAMGTGVFEEEDIMDNSLPPELWSVLVRMH